MADKRTQRSQKKREKTRKRREARQKERRQESRDARGGLAQAVEWDVGTCYLSQNWHEQGAHVWACFVRTHHSGRCAVVLCEVDLRKRGVLDCRVDILPSAEHVQGVLTKYSEPHAMLETGPELVVKVIVEGAEHGRKAGHSPPKALQKGLPLFAGVDPANSEHDLLLGDEPPPEEKTSWWKRVFGG